MRRAAVIPAVISPLSLLLGGCWWYWLRVWDPRAFALVLLALNAPLIEYVVASTTHAIFHDLIFLRGGIGAGLAPLSAVPTSGDKDPRTGALLGGF